MFRQRVGIVRMYVVASLAETDRQTDNNEPDDTGRGNDSFLVFVIVSISIVVILYTIAEPFLQ